MKTAYEFIVVGCGGLGSAAAYWLSRMAGSEVLALEQFSLGHDNGASQDHSRIIRLSYHAPEYTALTPHTYTAWQEVEEESGVQLVVKTGGLDLAPEGSDALDGYADAMRVADIPFDCSDRRRNDAALAAVAAASDRPGALPGRQRAGRRPQGDPDPCRAGARARCDGPG